MSKKDTPVIKFVRQAWDYAASNPHSWERFNQDVREVCLIAAAGFPWEEGDTDKIFKIGDVWRCLGACELENVYTTAVRNGNASAWTELERYLKRTPIIADNVIVARYGGQVRKRSRICIGASFPWKGEVVNVTSFNKDGHAVCCSYKPGIDVYGPKKIQHRYVISADDVKKERKVK